jgi:hypothetical protein
MSGRLVSLAFSFLSDHSAFLPTHHVFYLILGTTASDILDSLVLLTSLRPRVSGSESSAPPPLIPPSSMLHRLHQTLPIKPSKGWYGSLPSANPIALRDDTTLRVRPGAIIPQPYVAATTAPGTAVVPTQTTPGLAPTNATAAAAAAATAAGYAAYPYGAYSPATYQSLYAAAGYKPPAAGTYPAGAYNPSQYYAQYTAAAAARQQQGQQPGPVTPGGINNATTSTPATATTPAPQWYAYTPAQAAVAAAAAGMLAAPQVRANGVGNSTSSTNGGAGSSGGSASGRGTPQPQSQQQPLPYYIPQPLQRPPSTTPGPVAASSGAAAPATPRAVGNLAIPAAHGSGSEWERRVAATAGAAGGGYVAPPTPTLPLHLRGSASSAVVSQPGTPVPATPAQASR